MKGCESQLVTPKNAILVLQKGIQGKQVALHQYIHTRAYSLSTISRPTCTVKSVRKCNRLHLGKDYDFTLQYTLKPYTKNILRKSNRKHNRSPFTG